MKIVADENCDGILVAALRSSGFDVLWIREASPGIDDAQIYEIATAGGSFAHKRSGFRRDG